MVAALRETSPSSCFNVLLTEDRPHAAEHYTRQLGQLLRPQGVHAFVVQSGEQAMELVESTPIHAAVIDSATPRSGKAGQVSASQSSGLWLLELLHRLPNRPPVVLVRGPSSENVQARRMLSEALRLGAFTVLDKPVDLEQLLAVFHRLLQRQYRGCWPDHAQSQTPNPPASDQPNPADSTDAAQGPVQRRFTQRFSIRIQRKPNA